MRRTWKVGAVRRRRWRRSAVAECVLVMAILLGSCADGGERLGSGDGTPIPTLAEPNREEALLVGVLGGERREGQACLWIDADSGHRSTVVWPPGYAARLEGGGALLLDGGEVARFGDEIALSGGFHRGRAGECAASGTDTFWAGGVTNCAAEPERC